MNHILYNMYSKMKFLTDWKDGRKDEMVKMTDKIKKQSYGQENCMVCNKVFIKYHNKSRLCSDECKIIRQREYEHEWRKNNSNYTKKNRERINATQRRYYHKSKKDPEWVKKKNKYQEEWNRKKKENEMMEMTDKKYKLTLEELEDIKQRLADGKSWAAIRDGMFYTYTDGYLITTTALSRQYYAWKYKQNNPPNPTMGQWNAPETKAIIGMWNTGLPRMLMLPAVNRTYAQVSSKILNLKNANRLVPPHIRERNVMQVALLTPSLIHQRAMTFYGPYSTVPVFNVVEPNDEKQTVAVNAPISRKEIKQTPPPETDVPLELVGNLSKENVTLKKTNESLMKALTALEETMTQTEETSKEIHNSNLKTKQGNPTIMDDNGNQLDKTSQDIVTQCQYVCDLLLAKNKQYGDSVSKPLRIFSKADSSEQIKVRIDDKISRLVRGDDSLESDEDIIDDLIGYLVLLKIQMNK